MYWAAPVALFRSRHLELGWDFSTSRAGKKLLFPPWRDFSQGRFTSFGCLEHPSVDSPSSVVYTFSGWHRQGPNNASQASCTTANQVELNNLECLSKSFPISVDFRATVKPGMNKISSAFVQSLSGVLFLPHQPHLKYLFERTNGKGEEMAFRIPLCCMMRNSTYMRCGTFLEQGK